MSDIRDDVERTGDVERHDARIGRARVWFYVDHRLREVHLASLRVPQQARRVGHGSRALAYVLAIADDLGYTTLLGASPLDRRTTLRALIRLYQRFGFELTGRSINPAGDPEMVRRAQGPR